MAAVSEAGSGPDHGDMAAIRTGLEMRPIEAADGARLRRFHSRLSARTIYLRYHAPHPDLREGELRFLVNPDPSKHVAWVACDEAGEIVGVCRVVAQDCLRSRGDIAIVVADDAQRTGVGRALLTRVLEEAARAGFGMVDALILRDNLPARELFVSTAGRLDLPHAMRHLQGVVDVVISLAPPRPEDGVALT